MARLACVVMALVVLAGCTNATSGATIDGWLVGPPATCTDWSETADGVVVDHASCADLPAAADRAFDVREPGHVPVVSTELHERRWPPGTCCGLQYVQVFRLADGS
ncbi:MAG TPA: hypothetical protein VFI15_11305, partial [Candidatus Limnocylindrales bacterium]|nr:hypothetical protein [Candidatus Limnocylindrales bacterium]